MMGRAVPVFRQARLCNCKSHGFVGLTRGGTAPFSPQDLGTVQPYLWTKNHGYAVRTDYTTGRKVNVRMHRLVLGLDGEEFPDHANRDGCDNRRENLRLCTRSGNMTNRKPWGSQRFKGVDYHKRDNLYRARLSVDGKLIVVGSFRSAEEAARAYDKAALALHQNFALTNAALGLLPGGSA